ncbi:HAMP domain-containing protein, partial [Luteimonas saliphila]|uniref:HAMP domain-containing protein n=1 Tax=Luteimonas saliphila TaxID=2804919 RepID=UPI00192DE515
MFKSLSIGKRLAIGFAVLSLLIVAIGGFAVQRMGKMQEEVLHLTHHSVPAIRDLGRMATALAEYRVSERGLVSSAADPAKLEEYRSELVTGREQYDALAESYAARVDSDSQRAAYDDVLAKSALYFANSVRLVEALKVGDLGPAGAAGDLRQAAADAVGALLDDTQKALDAAVAAEEAEYAANIAAISILLALALALAIAAALLITRSIVRPLSEVMGAADAVARGDLDRPITVVERSEVGALASSMRDMVATLKGFVAAQRGMHEAHDAGDIDHRIAAEDFKGAFGEMAGQVNALVASHISVKMKLVALAQEYAKGDLSRDMDRLPGKKAVLTEAMDATKANLAAISAEIQRLSAAAAAGDFSQRGEAQRFDFVYREMVESLNLLMSSADAGLGEIGSLLSAVAEGDLSRRIDA